ncbi:MAG: enoyl-CoA hydratase/isomerase family protein [Myxococcota bacterium]
MADGRGRVATSKLLDADAALARLRDPGALDRLSALGGESPLLVDLRGEDPAAWTGAGLLGTLPCPSVAWVDAGGEAPGFDVVVESETALHEVTQKIRRNPLASLALVQLLRLNEARSLHEGLVAESLVYATLQAGPEFYDWLSAKRPPKPRPDAEGPAVRIERDGETLHLTLDRPAKRNAFSAEMRDGLCEGLTVALADESIAHVELRGEGPCFCSGGDLDEFGTLPDPATAHAIRSTRNPGRLLVACADRVRATVQGACVGAGIELPAFAAHVTARADATFRLPEVSMGLVPGAGGTASLPRRIGRQRTAWMALSGAVVDAKRAAAWGLVDEVIE